MCKDPKIAELVKVESRTVVTQENVGTGRGQGGDRHGGLLPAQLLTIISGGHWSRKEY